MKEEELEFISVTNEDDNDMNSSNFVDPYAPSTSNSAIGNWFFNQSKHPSALFFHLFFKFLALWLYVFGSWVTDSFILVFVLCIILLAFDFWTVKNVSGRLLVGLRWWSYVKEDGSNDWLYEFVEDEAEISNFDSTVFWGALYITPALWAFFLVMGLLRLKFEYMPIVIAALMMSGANIMGYYECSKRLKQKTQRVLEGRNNPGGLPNLETGMLHNWALSTLLAITSANPAAGQSAGRANNV